MMPPASEFMILSKVSNPQSFRESDVIGVRCNLRDHIDVGCAADRSSSSVGYQQARSDATNKHDLVQNGRLAKVYYGDRACRSILEPVINFIPLLAFI